MLWRRLLLKKCALPILGGGARVCLEEASTDGR